VVRKLSSRWISSHLKSVHFCKNAIFKTVQFRCTGNAPILCILESSHIVIKFYAVNILHELIAFSGGEQNFAAY
jgi:hypothetical protein